MEESVYFFRTADGSWTAAFSPEGERMHNLAGAFSETVHVYSPAICAVLAKKRPLKFLSVGLGLGHVEILLAAYAVARGGARSI